MNIENIVSVGEVCKMKDLKLKNISLEDDKFHVQQTDEVVHVIGNFILRLEESNGKIIEKKISTKITFVKKEKKDLSQAEVVSKVGGEVLKIKKHMSDLNKNLYKRKDKESKIGNFQGRLQKIVGPPSSFFSKILKRDAPSKFNLESARISTISLNEFGIEQVGLGKVKKVFKSLHPGKVLLTSRKERFLQRSRETELKDESKLICEIASKIEGHEQKHLAIDFEKLKQEEMENLPETLRRKTVFTTAKAEGNLDAFIQYANFDQKKAFTFGEQILDGMHKLHKANYVHGDLKLENILVYRDPDGKELVKISDFGKAISLGPSENSVYKGNFHFLAPEIQLSQKSEVYSVGLMLIRLFEQPLLKDKNTDMLLPVDDPKEKGVDCSGIEKFLVMHPDCPQLAKPIFKRVTQWVQARLHIAPAVRNEAAVEAYIDALISGLKEKMPEKSTTLEGIGTLLKKMTQNDPAKRPTLEDALIQYRNLIS